MDGPELKGALTALAITQADFARLVNVTPRAVSLWLIGDRAIPGPAVAYLQLLQRLPPSQRQIEFAKLKDRRIAMGEGMYAIEFSSRKGAGYGTLILENGRAYGADVCGVRFDGDYVFNEKLGVADLKLKLTFPPNVEAVFGISNPYEWSVDVVTQLDPRQLPEGTLKIITPFGPQIDVSYQHLRALPEAA